MDTSVQYRVPTALVHFVGTETIPVMPGQLASVQTRKSLAEPAGSFEVMLKSGTSMGAGNFAPGEGGVASPSTDYWMEKIRPMSLCIIAIGSGNELGAVRRAITASALPDDQPGSVERAVVMVGIVDDVTTTTVMGENGPMRSVRVSGRDMARLLLDDILFRVVNAAEKGGGNLIALDNGVGADEKQDLIRRMQIEGLWFGQSLAEGAQLEIPLSAFFGAVLERAPSLRTKMLNGRPATDYFSRNVELDSTIAQFSGVLQLLNKFMNFNGAPWQALQDLAPKPMVECFVDTVGLKARLVVRRPPFARPSTMSPDDFNRLLAHTFKQSFITASPNKTYVDDAVERTLRDPRVAGMPTVDQFTTVRSRVVPGGYHTVKMSEIIQSTFSRSVREAITLYLARDVMMMAAAEMIPGLLRPAIYDMKAALKYGTITLPIMLPWGVNRPTDQGFFNSSTLPEKKKVRQDFSYLVGIRERLTRPPGADAAKQDSQDRQNGLFLSASNYLVNIAEAVRAYFFFRDNPEFLNGVIAMRGRPEIRIGDRIRIPDYGDRIFYVEQVEQVFQYGSPFLTRLALSRGQPFAPKGRLNGDDGFPIDSVGGD
jgi:hypothetical protein